MPSRLQLLVASAAILAGCQATTPNLLHERAPTPPDAIVPDGIAQAAAAPTRRPFDERFCLRAGALAAGEFSTQSSLDLIGTSVGTDIDFERDLGLAGHTESIRLDTYWRFDRKNRIDVGFFDLQRSGSRTLSRDIEWGDVTFPVSATVTSFMDTQIIPVRYTHSFVATDEVDAGLGIGIYFMQLDTGLQANNLGLTRSFKTPLPLPVLSVHATWEFVPRLQLFGMAQAFYVDLEGLGEVESLHGSILDANIGLEYELLDHASVGASVNYFKLAADAADDRFLLDVEYGYTGLFVFLALKI